MDSLDFISCNETQLLLRVLPNKPLSLPSSQKLLRLVRWNYDMSRGYGIQQAQFVDPYGAIAGNLFTLSLLRWTPELVYVLLLVELATWIGRFGFYWCVMIKVPMFWRKLYENISEHFDFAGIRLNFSCTKETWNYLYSLNLNQD